MKKIFRYALLSAIAMFSTAAMAETIETMGSVDKGWGEQFHTYIIPANQTLELTFVISETNGGDFDGFCADVLQNNVNVLFIQPGGGYLFNGDGDDWWDGDKSHSDGGNLSMDSYQTVFPGATVVMTFRRFGTRMEYFADIRKDATRLYRRIISNEGTFDAIADVAVNLGADHAVLTKIVDNMVNESITGTLIGSLDNSKDFGAGEKAEYVLPADEELTVHFINYASRINFGDNWLVEIQNGDKFLDLRSDFWGWEYPAEIGYFERTEDQTLSKYFTLTSSTGFYFDGFPYALHRADVTLTVTRSGSEIIVKAVQTCVSGEVKTQTYTLNHDDFATGSITVRLMAAYAHLDILSSGITTNIKSLKDTGNHAVRYNLAGQVVGTDYQGLVIENGKKIVVK